MLNIIVMSFNRSMQLELLLRSLKIYFKEWQQANISIIYKSSNELFEAGYDKCKELHPEFCYIDEKNIAFKDAVLVAIDDSNPFTMCLVDDQVMKSSFSLLDEEVQQFANSEDILCLSLRLSKHVNYCYPTNQNIMMPIELSNGQNVWTWPNAQGDFQYPTSLDGHIFQTDLFKNLADQLQYHNPNSFEARMFENTKNILEQTGLNKMLCYLENSKFVNIPLNRVQQTFNNRFQDSFSAEKLNEMFLAGQKIKLESFHEIKNNAPHMELELVFYQE